MKFYTYMYLIITCANHLSILYIIYNIYEFFKPSMYYNEYILFRKSIALFSIIWILNILILYNIILSLSWNFFLSYQYDSMFNNSTQFFFEAKLEEYIMFLYELYYISIISQIFLVFSIFTIKNYKINKKYLYSSILIFSTVVTPPDIISQLIVSITIIIVIEIYIYMHVMFSILRKPVKTY